MKKILLSEGSSLTARETLTALHDQGYQVDILTSTRFPLTRFSCWRGKMISIVNPNKQPLHYLQKLRVIQDREHYAAILPTHEECWLFAAAGEKYLADLPIVVAPYAEFEKVQSKINFAFLLDQLGIRQPKWQLSSKGLELEIALPFWLKSEYGTAGQAVKKICSLKKYQEELRKQPFRKDNRLMLQENIEGTYGQVQAFFAQGIMQAVHTTLQTGRGVGNSAAARKSVVLPGTIADIEKIGKHLKWQGCLTLDFILSDGQTFYLECNPRMVEPGNAAKAGVNFPKRLIQLTTGELPRKTLQVGRAGVQTRGLQALLLGTAEETGKRRGIITTFYQAIKNKNVCEVLTPVHDDRLSLLPITFVLLMLLIAPANGQRFARAAIQNYSISPEVIQNIRNLVEHNTQ